jgi:hypothetical protein
MALPTGITGREYLGFIQNLSETQSSSENALAYCLQAIAETEKKVGIMKSHIAKMEEEINGHILRNELLTNDLESNNVENENFPSQNLSLQTTLSQSVS